MFARLTAKAILVAIAIAMAFCGVSLLGTALASTLVVTLGVAGAHAVAGAILLLPPLIWAVIARPSRPRKLPPQTNNELIRALLAAVAKETPWLAIVGAGVAGAVNMFLNRNKPGK
jgi:hypothetical protein